MHNFFIFFFFFNNGECFPSPSCGGWGKGRPDKSGANKKMDTSEKKKNYINAKTFSLSKETELFSFFSFLALKPTPVPV